MNRLSFLKRLGGTVAAVTIGAKLPAAAEPVEQKLEPEVKGDWYEPKKGDILLRADGEQFMVTSLFGLLTEEVYDVSMLARCINRPETIVVVVKNGKIINKDLVLFKSMASEFTKKPK